MWRHLLPPSITNIGGLNLSGPEGPCGFDPRPGHPSSLRAGELWSGEGDFVFTDEIGEPVHPSALSRLFASYVRWAGLPTIRLHDLRHTYATVALGAGVHPKIVSERLGHATTAVTLDLYSHVTPTIDAEAATLVTSKIFDRSGAGDGER
jgi:integrase